MGGRLLLRIAEGTWVDPTDVVGIEVALLNFGEGPGFGGEDVRHYHWCARVVIVGDIMIDVLCDSREDAIAMADHIGRTLSE